MGGEETETEENRRRNCREISTRGNGHSKQYFAKALPGVFLSMIAKMHAIVPCCPRLLFPSRLRSELALVISLRLPLEEGTLMVRKIVLLGMASPSQQEFYAETSLK
jgi:hypothetical protein